MNYGLTRENQNLINEKAKTKSDGVYRFRRITYKVVNNEVVLLCVGNEILQPFGLFNAIIGGKKDDEDAAKVLKKIGSNS